MANRVSPWLLLYVSQVAVQAQLQDAPPTHTWRDVHLGHTCLHTPHGFLMRGPCTAASEPIFIPHWLAGSGGEGRVTVLSVGPG